MHSCRPPSALRPAGLLASLAYALATACTAPPRAAEEPPAGPPELSQLSFQAVDAGTGAALRDEELTVRWLVRAPTTLDTAAVERVRAVEPYRIAQAVAEDALVVEVRLEAPSYHRLDTALSVPRGGTAGPLTLRMSRRLDQLAERELPVVAPSAPPQGTDGGAGASSGGSAASGGGSTAASGAQTRPPPPPSPAAVALEAGDRAYQRGDWLAAAEAYARLPVPDDPSSTYGRRYQQALVRRGVAHMNRGEYGSALEVLEEAARFGDPGYNTYLRLAQAQCATGRSAEGRGTLAVLGRGVGRMPAADRPLVRSLIQYQTGVCTHGEFDRAETTRDRVRTGAATIRELEEFIAEAGRVSPSPRQLDAAVQDARRRIDLVRGQVRGRS